MSNEHVLVLSAAHRPQLGAARAIPGLLAAQDAPDGRYWLRGLPASAPLPPAVRALPAQVRYQLDAAGWLFEPGRLAPAGRLPALPWQPIAELLPLEVPPAALPGQGAPRYVPRLLPATQPAPSVALLATLPAWLRYAETAPEIRLQPLRFAAAADGRVLVLGTPLPPLPGQELWQRGALLLPAGHDLEAPVLAALLAERLATATGSWVLFAPDGGYELLAQGQLVAASRAAVRLTASTLRHAG